MTRPSTIALALEAAARLTTAQILVAVCSGPRLMRLLGPVERSDTATEDACPRWPAARRVARVVDRVGNLLPWHPVCLPRAMTTRAMLRRRAIPCELHLGVTSTAPLAAHAWVTVGGRVVQGGSVEHVTPLATLR
ncbi:lasso peptide biosynthesis B2 protein [Verrucosispora sp. WMMA2044]|uniref:Lasso peptide biosynthesis B2 protein n=1 Tax=Verrucosispora sioxanthis TaxID=2499994 RepID=A0A6M1KU54_9ACTN|nr:MULTISPECIES: lasso peptide biosynthesis B2 protein [Micromonospora]NEE62459.1 lasso peptide biosynthesis B2 protein [Verrucosispora sioxanthis]NGM11569.1 lasso peptide biosynthesis B2 protein [Verrucosispora sioxanthis]WBB46812.1 lasso peptide biosynthesis B2 protein [Verrucosispora sp. WMMA2044]